jgi:hypothetical protein
MGSEILKKQSRRKGINSDGYAIKISACCIDGSTANQWIPRHGAKTKRRV